METAEVWSRRSYDDQYQVGAVVVRDGCILAQGWNGVVAGLPNTTRDSEGNTRPEVVHAEANAIAKLAKNGGGSKGATIYTTHSPCYTCGLLLIQAGVERIVYRDVYDKEALSFLEERGIKVEQIRGDSKLPTWKSAKGKC